MPLSLIASLIDAQTLEPVPPTEERQRFFEQTSFMPYEMPLVTDQSDAVSLDCPFCSTRNHLVRWVTADNKGFAQIDFEHRCESCGRTFKKKSIGIRRFSEEVSRKRAQQRMFIS
jgi:hypothetical protein